MDQNPNDFWVKKQKLPKYYYSLENQNQLGINWPIKSVSYNRFYSITDTNGPFRFLEDDVTADIRILMQQTSLSALSPSSSPSSPHSLTLQLIRSHSSAALGRQMTYNDKLKRQT